MGALIPPDEIALDAARPTRARYAVLASLSLVAAIAYLERQLISIVAAPMEVDLHLTKTQMGSVMSSFFVGYALFQIPCGWLADRWGSRKSLALFAVVWSVAAGAMAFASDYTSAAALWFTAGSAQAGAFACAASSLRKWLPMTRWAFGSGMLGSFMSLGGALSALLAGSLAEQLSWRELFVVFSLPGVVWGIVFFWWFRDTPTSHSSTNLLERQLIAAGQPDQLESADAELVAASMPWLSMLASPSMWAICGQQFFRAAAYIFFATWFPTYLEQTRGVSLEQAGALTSLPLVAVVLGSPLGGIASDWLLARTGNRRVSRCFLSASSLSLCAGLIVAAYFVLDARLAVLVISAGSFCAAFGGVSAYTITLDLGGRHVATVFSVMNMCGNLGAALFPSLVGRWVDATGRWDEVLLIFAAIYIAAAACWMSLNPRRMIFRNSLEPVVAGN